MTQEQKRKNNKKQRHKEVIFQLDKIKWWNYENNKLLRSILEELEKLNKKGID